MTAVLIRPASRSDVTALTRTAVRSWAHAYQGVLTAEAVEEAPQRLAEAIAHDWREMYVAEAGADIVGFFDFDPGTSHIRHIYVDPDHHRLGIGRLMMEAALDVLRERGHEQATIDVVEGTGAREFHRALGWRERTRTAGKDGVLVISMVHEL